MNRVISTLLFSIQIILSHSAYAPDEILALPGWDGALPSKQYSGYLNVSDTKLHYWLVQSESNPASDPTVLWFNGGPGCSSLDGFIYEHGPFEVSKDFQTLSLRPYRWNRMVNMLYIESPVGVGFSYSEAKNYVCDDERTATENRAAVEAFFSMFPELKANKFYITGESYAGVYVPTLAEAIVNGEKDGSYTGAKLNGIAVGNGCSGTEVGICGNGPQGTYYEWQYLINDAFVDQGLKDSINAQCDWASAAKNIPNSLSAQCVKLLNQASGEIGHVNLYNVYGDCVDDMCSASGDDKKILKRGKVPARSEYVVNEMSAALELNDLVDNSARRLARIIPQGPDACIDSGLATGYLTRPEVMSAIHVMDPGYCWAVCNTAPGWSYTSTRTNLPANTYPLLVSNINVVIFNGDWDACVPYTDGQAWTSGMNYPIKKQWHSWTFTSTEGNANQVAGYATVFDVSSLGSGAFSFVTVKGGRHEVPESAPAQAFELLRKLVSDEAF